MRHPEPDMTSNERFVKLKYFYPLSQPVFDLFKQLNDKPYMSFPNWGVTTKNKYVFALVRSLTDDPHNVYVICSNVLLLTEDTKTTDNILQEISHQIENDITASR